MQILSSEWLERMVIKSSASPKARITNLFVILQDWLNAPGIRDQLTSASPDRHNEVDGLLFSLVSDAKLEEPEKLAFQLYFILLGAINEEIRNPGSNTMEHARAAAASLVAASTPSRIKKPRAFAVAATAMVGVIAGSLLLPISTTSKHVVPVMQQQELQTHNIVPVALSPDRVVALYRMHDKIRTAQCSYPQALMLSADKRAVFLEGVVNIDQMKVTSSDLDQVSQLYQMVDCYYPPAAMLL